MSENARQDRKARKENAHIIRYFGHLLLVMAILTIVVAAAGGEGVREALPLPEIAGEILAGGVVGVSRAAIFGPLNVRHVNIPRAISIQAFIH